MITLRLAILVGLTAFTSLALVAEDPPQEIRLDLKDGRYDENKLREFFGGAASGEPRYRELGSQDRLGLVALELVGKIEFQVSSDELVLRRKETPRWELMKILAPPRLEGVEKMNSSVGRTIDVILFVHGLEGGGSTFSKAVRRCEERGIVGLTYEYPNDGPPAEIGVQMAGQIDDFLKEHRSARIHIIAHSLGGLVSTWAVTEMRSPSSKVPNVVTLGTPFKGSELASFHDELELYDVVYRLATGKLSGLDTIHDGQGQAAEALEPGSEFLRSLHQRKLPDGIQFHLAAGTKSFLNEDRRRRLSEALPAEMRRLSISREYSESIQKLLQAEELRDGKGDGAVTVESALGLQNPATTTTFSLTHLSLVASESPLEWALERCELIDLAIPNAK